MISNAHDLYLFIDRIFNPYGFIRKKDCYYKNSDECIVFFSLGKTSNASGYFDHVMGCFLKELQPKVEKYPAYYKCNLKFHLGEFIERQKILDVFSLNHTLPEFQREVIIQEWLLNIVIPFLKKIDTKKGVGLAMAEYPRLIHYADGELMALLDLKYP